MYKIAPAFDFRFAYSAIKLEQSISYNEFDSVFKFFLKNTFSESIFKIRTLVN